MYELTSVVPKLQGIPVCKQRTKQKLVLYLDKSVPLTCWIDAMATAASVTTDLTTCPICLDIYDNPKSLPCLHAFCLKCLQGLYKYKLPGDGASCPKCRKEFQIPPDGVDGFPHHFIVQQLVEMMQQRGNLCDKHKDKEVELYCYDCNENICLMCSAVKHKNHNSGEIPEVVQDFRIRIDDDDNQILSAISFTRGESEQTHRAASEFLSNAEDVKKVVRATGNAVKGLVDDQINAMLMELQSVTSESANSTENSQDGYELALVKLESFHTYSRELLDKGRPSDITQAACELHDRATELLNNDVTAVKYRPPHVTFTPTDLSLIHI